MAVREDDYVKKTYYKIYGGRVVREWYQDESPEGIDRKFLTKRITEESKKTVWYKPYIFSGVITDVFEKKNDRINAFQFHIEIDGDSVLVMNSNSGSHKSFLLTMGNLPIGEDITFSPYNFPNPESKGKRIIGMNFKDSEGEKIQPCYTKEKPNGLPPAKQNKKGEWNFTKQQDFLDLKFEAWHKEYFTKQETYFQSLKQANEPEEVAKKIEAKEDVPF